MTRRITATEAARTFSDLVNRIRYRGEEFVVEGLPRLDDEYLAIIERNARRQPKVPKAQWD